MMPSPNRGIDSPWLLVPPAIFLFFLPFAHTVSVRLLSLFVTLLIVVALWKRYRPPALPCKIPVLFWASLALLSMFYTVDADYSAGEIKNEIGYVVVAFVIFYVSAHNAFSSRLFLAVIALSFTVLTVWALGSYLYLGHWNETGYFAGSASYTSYVVTVAPLAVLLLWVPPRFRLWAYLTAPVLIGAALACAFLTYQRIVWPVLVLQSGLGVFLLYRKQSITASGKWLATGLIVGLTCAMLALQAVSQNRFGKDLLFSIAEDIRITKIPMVTDIIMEEPLTGHGFGRRILVKAYPEVVREESAFWHAHNVFLNYGVQLGIPGIIAIAAVFLCLLYQFYRLYRSGDAVANLLGIAGLLMVVGVVARNQTNDMFGRDLALLFAALAGLMLGYGRRRLAGGSG